MFKPPYNPTIDNIKAELKRKEYGYWEIALRPETDIIPMDIEKFWNIFDKSQIRHRGWFFPHVSRNTYGGSFCKDERIIKNHTHYAQYVDWWNLVKDGSFDMEMGIVEDRIEGIINSRTFSSWTPDKDIPPKNNILDSTNTIYQLMEIERFTTNLAEYLEVNYYIDVKIYGMKDRYLLTWLDNEKNCEDLFKNDELSINNIDSNNGICNVDEIVLERKNISMNNIESPFVLEHMRHIYNKFNHYHVNKSDFDDSVREQISNYHKIDIIKNEEHNYKLKK